MCNTTPYKWRENAITRFPKLRGIQHPTKEIITSNDVGDCQRWDLWRITSPITGSGALCCSRFSFQKKLSLLPHFGIVWGSRAVSPLFSRFLTLFFSFLPTLTNWDCRTAAEGQRDGRKTRNWQLIVLARPSEQDPVLIYLSVKFSLNRNEMQNQYKIPRGSCNGSCL